MLPENWITEAVERISPHIHKTSLTYDSQQDIYLKWENQQVTGSFKIRGAVNKILSLEKWEIERGLVTASAGNHGLGVALGGKMVKTPVTVFVSEHAAPAKVKAIQALGTDIRFVPGGYENAEKTGIKHAKAQGSIWISPYNDGQVIAGQATIALEILEKEAALLNAVWFVPVGGGGLISGIGSCLKSSSSASWIKSIDRHALKIFGVQSQASPFMHRFFHTGSQEGAVELPSLADGLSGAVEAQSLTFHMVRQFVDDFLLVNEEEIVKAIAHAWHRYNQRIEGSAAVTLAAAMYHKTSERPAVVILSGGNIQPEKHKDIITQWI